jgi:hypothetical protein
MISLALPLGPIKGNVAALSTGTTTLRGRYELIVFPYALLQNAIDSSAHRRMWW